MSTRGQGHCLTFVQDHSDLYFQTSTVKTLCPYMSQISCRAFMDWKNKSSFKQSWSCDQDGHHVHIITVKKKSFFSESSRLITFALYIQHQGLESYKICSNDSWLTLTYVTKLTLLPNAFVWENCNMLKYCCFIFIEIF